MSIFDSFQDRCDNDGLDDSALPFDDDIRGEPRVPKHGIRLNRNDIILQERQRIAKVISVRLQPVDLTSKLTFNGMRTGSVVYGTGSEYPNDIDYLALYDRDFMLSLISDGWVLDISYPFGNNARFVSLRKGILNLILGNTIFVDQWIKGHDACVAEPENCTTKEGRIAIFDRFRDQSMYSIISYDDPQISEDLIKAFGQTTSSL